MIKYITPILILYASLGYTSEWELVWADEFNTTGLPDDSKWNYEEGFIRNQEEQYYTKSRTKNVRIEDGVLVIEALEEKFLNLRYTKNAQGWQGKNKYARYTSGSINTLDKMHVKYGRIEIRAKLPTGRGIWSAIWMMGVNRPDVGWPYCGEIDIMENIGRLPNIIYSNSHFQDPATFNKKEPRTSGGGKITLKEPHKNFFTYAIEWDENHITYSVEKNVYSKLNIDVAGKGKDNPFRKEFYLIINLALGGAWAGNIDKKILPQKLEIDYVRIYKKLNTISTQG